MRCTAHHALHCTPCAVLPTMHRTARHAMYCPPCAALPTICCTVHHMLHRLPCTALPAMRRTAHHSLQSSSTASQQAAKRGGASSSSCGRHPNRNDAESGRPDGYGGGGGGGGRDGKAMSESERAEASKKVGQGRAAGRARRWDEVGRHRTSVGAIWYCWRCGDMVGSTALLAVLKYSGLYSTVGSTVVLRAVRFCWQCGSMMGGTAVFFAVQQCYVALTRLA